MQRHRSQIIFWKQWWLTSDTVSSEFKTKPPCLVKYKAWSVLPGFSLSVCWGWMVIHLGCLPPNKLNVPGNIPRHLPTGPGLPCPFSSALSRAGELHLNCPVWVQLTDLGIVWESSNWHSLVLGNVLAAFWHTWSCSRDGEYFQTRLRSTDVSTWFSWNLYGLRHGKDSASHRILDASERWI